MSRPFDETDCHAFVDGQMDLDRRAAFMRALSANPDLKSRLRTWKEQNEALLATFGPVLSEPVPVRLMPTSVGRDQRAARIETVRPAPRPAPPLRAGPDRGRGGAGSLVGVAVLAFLIGALLAFGLLEAFVDRPGGRTSLQDAAPAGFGRALAQRAYEAHETFATDLNHPVEVSALDRPALIRWIQHRLALPVRIPDLRSEGWELLGGRILPGELGPAAYLLYTNGVERLGFYMARTNARQSDEVAIYDNDAGLASAAYWTDEPIGYALTTSRDAAWLSRSAPALVRSIKAQARDNASAN